MPSKICIIILETKFPLLDRSGTFTLSSNDLQTLIKYFLGKSGSVIQWHQNYKGKLGVQLYVKLPNGWASNGTCICAMEKYIYFLFAKPSYGNVVYTRIRLDNGEVKFSDSNANF